MDDGIKGHASTNGEKTVIDYCDDMRRRICFGLAQKANTRAHLPMNVRFRETEKVEIRRGNQMFVFQ